MARILGFYNEETEQEYVVITEDEDTPVEDWEIEGFKLLCEVELSEDVGKLPTDRNLWKRA